MPEDPDLISVAEQIATDWNNAGVDYAVLHGLSRYPAALGRDLDVLFAPESVSKGLRTAAEILRQHGYSVAIPHPIWGPRIVGVRTGEHPSALEIHGMTSVSWRNVEFAERPQPAEAVGPFRTDPWAGFAKRVLLPLLCDGPETFSRRPGDFRFASELEAAEAAVHLEPRLGTKRTGEIADAVRRGAPQSLSRQLNSIRRRLVANALRSDPLRSSVRLLRIASRRLNQFCAPCGPILAVLGPDGAGKSTVIGELCRLGVPPFTSIPVRHWRPGLLPLRSGRGTATRSTVTSNLEWFRHWPKLMYYLADYWMGHIFRDLVDTSRQRLIIYDRWAADLFVDPQRFGLSSAHGALLLARMVPRPDLIVLLAAMPAQIHNRKQELTLDEIGTQLHRYHGLSGVGLLDRELDATLPPDDLARSLASLALGVFVAKNQHGPRGPCSE